MLSGRKRENSKLLMPDAQRLGEWCIERERGGGGGARGGGTRRSSDRFGERTIVSLSPIVTKPCTGQTSKSIYFVGMSFSYVSMAT